MTPNPDILTEKQIAGLVDAGSAIHQQIASLKIRLKSIDEKLTAHALAVPEQHVKLIDEDREGTRLLCTGSPSNFGSDPAVVPVVLTSDLIAQTLGDSSPQLEKVRAAASNKFQLFYKRVVSYNTVFAKSNRFDGKAFRAAARSEITDPEAFIAACVRRNKDGVPVSAIKVEWP